jgi:DNA-binding HxlR family transcriptional regulator
MATLGQKHVLGILGRLSDQSPQRFHQLRDGLHINPRTLTIRLVELQRLGVVARTVHRVVPRRVAYDLTPMGRDLVLIFATLHQWKSKYSAPGSAGALAPAPCSGLPLPPGKIDRRSIRPPQRATGRSVDRRRRESGNSTQARALS